jgi:uncharacterized RDD family membrane protein YckC
MTDEGPDQFRDGTGAMPVPPPPQPATPPPVFNPAPASSVGAPADLGTRFLARLIDHILLGIVNFVIIVPLIVAAAFTGVGNGLNVFGGASVGGFVAAIVTAVITIGYFALMESNMGQTVGKMLLSLKTVGPDGNKPTLEQALKRNSWYALGIIPFLGGLAQLAATIYIAVTINNSATKMGWHDTFAGGTKVIKTK